jgi:putative iron-regulated protein
MLFAAVMAISCVPPAREDLEIRVLTHYADLVHATYLACYERALSLQSATVAFIDSPSEQGLHVTKQAWLKARVPYGQSEVFRFYGGPIDDDDGPEGLLNAWPMDESYVDGVAEQPNSGIIHDRQRYPELTEELLVSLNEQEGEENISTGYHAIEFLLWGQDLDAAGPGNRPVTDFTTAVNANRRKVYLRVVTQRLVSDLEGLVAEWAPGRTDNYRASFVSLPANKAMTNILNGMGMMSGFELANERLDVPYRTKLQEDEHSCFSDNTHNDALQNAQGVANVFHGAFGETQGPGVQEILATFDTALTESLGNQIDQSVKLAAALQAPFDQLIQEGNNTGRGSIKALVDSLRTQAATLSELATRGGLQINIEE